MTSDVGSLMLSISPHTLANDGLLRLRALIGTFEAMPNLQPSAGIRRKLCMINPVRNDMIAHPIITATIWNNDNRTERQWLEVTMLLPEGRKGQRQRQLLRQMRICGIRIIWRKTFLFFPLPFMVHVFTTGATYGET
jgi:hypothetical protein